jgi:hypothetical protein
MMTDAYIVEIAPAGKARGIDAVDDWTAEMRPALFGK